jgi:hypothetical protein
MLSDLKLLPSDSILGLTAAFRAAFLQQGKLRHRF